MVGTNRGGQSSGARRGAGDAAARRDRRQPVGNRAGQRVGARLAVRGKAREHIELYATSGLPQGLVPPAEAAAMGLKDRAAATMPAGYRVCDGDHSRSIVAVAGSPRRGCRGHRDSRRRLQRISCHRTDRRPPEHHRHPRRRHGLVGHRLLRWRDSNAESRRAGRARRPLHAVLQHAALLADARQPADRALSASGGHGAPRQRHPRRVVRARRAGSTTGP